MIRKLAVVFLSLLAVSQGYNAEEKTLAEKSGEKTRGEEEEGGWL
jgi:hypothetical protein